MKIGLILALVCGFLACGCVFAQQPGSDRLIQFYQWRVSRDLGEYTNYEHLGSAYLQKARETGDPVYYELSEKSYDQALALLEKDKPEAAGTIARLSALYLAEHRFQESLSLSEKALALDPELLSAYATLGDAQLEMGEYAKAAFSYAKLKIPADLLPPRPGLAYLSETRQANLSYMLGKPQEAIEHMRSAIAKAREAQLTRENIAWSEFSLGELYFASGDCANAEAAYTAALETYPSYHRALAWMAQLRAAQGRYPEAAELYRKAIAIIPLPLYAASLGDVYGKMGLAEEARQKYELVDFVTKLSGLNQKLFRRELASFYAEHEIHLAEALEFALEELRERKDVYTWDVVAWAYFKNGRTTAAGDAIAHALAQGTRDPMLFFHAGMIYEKLGDSAKAREYLRRALVINPHFHIFYSEAARETLVRLAKPHVVIGQQEAPDVH